MSSISLLPEEVLEDELKPMLSWADWTRFRQTSTSHRRLSPADPDPAILRWKKERPFACCLRNANFGTWRRTGLDQSLRVEGQRLTRTTWLARFVGSKLKDIAVLCELACPCLLDCDCTKEETDEDLRLVLETGECGLPCADLFLNKIIHTIRFCTSNQSQTEHFCKGLGVSHEAEDLEFMALELKFKDGWTQILSLVSLGQYVGRTPFLVDVKPLPHNATHDEQINLFSELFCPDVALKAAGWFQVPDARRLLWVPLECPMPGFSSPVSEQTLSSARSLYDSVSVSRSVAAVPISMHLLSFHYFKEREAVYEKKQVQKTTLLVEFGSEGGEPVSCRVFACHLRQADIRPQGFGGLLHRLHDGERHPASWDKSAQFLTSSKFIAMPNGLDVAACVVTRLQPQQKRPIKKLLHRLRVQLPIKFSRPKGKTVGFHLSQPNDEKLSVVLYGAEGMGELTKALETTQKLAGALESVGVRVTVRSLQAFSGGRLAQFLSDWGEAEGLVTEMRSADRRRRWPQELRFFVRAKRQPQVAKLFHLLKQNFSD